MSIYDDPPLLRSVAEVGAVPENLLGIGGEACVFALDAERVVRIYHSNTLLEGVEARTSLLKALQPSACRLPFAIPEVLETRVLRERIATIERRLPGTPLLHLLARTPASQLALRARWIRAYLQAAVELSRLELAGKGFGDVSHGEPIRTSSFGAYLEQSAARSLLLAGSALSTIDPKSLAAAWPEPEQSAFVHLDVYPGNVLILNDVVTAVIDFGNVAILGDARLEPVAAAVYLTPAITPGATDQDRDVARSWLAERGLDALFAPAERWLAARWSFARDDQRLHEFCRSVLLNEGALRRRGQL